MRVYSAKASAPSCVKGFVLKAGQAKYAEHFVSMRDNFVVLTIGQYEVVVSTWQIGFGHSTEFDSFFEETLEGGGYVRAGIFEAVEDIFLQLD